MRDLQPGRIGALVTRLTAAVALLAALPAAAADDEPRPRPVAWATPTIQLQTWLTAFDQDESPQADPGGYGDPEHDVGFSMPRARLGFYGGWDVVDFGLRFGTSRPYDTLEPEPAPVDLVEGWSRLTFDTKAGVTQVTVGQHAIPFSREMLTSSNDLVFQERAVSSNWLSPIRDLGATASHQYKWVRLQAGVYNGGGDLFGDVDPGVQVATRLDLMFGGDTFRTNSEDHAVGFGAAYMYNRTFATEIQRVNVDLMARYMGVYLQVEGGMNFLDPIEEGQVILPPDVPEVTQRWGGYAQLGYYRELPLGAIEPSVRFAYFDDARHLKDNGDVGVLHAGVSWREPVPFVDLGAGYIHRMEFQGRTIDNDTVRVWTGLRYPSRKYAPVDLVEMFRRLGTSIREEGAPATSPKRKRGGRRQAD